VIIRIVDANGIVNPRQLFDAAGAGGPGPGIVLNPLIGGEGLDPWVLAGVGASGASAGSLSIDCWNWYVVNRWADNQWIWVIRPSDGVYRPRLRGLDHYTQW